MLNEMRSRGAEGKTKVKKERERGKRDLAVRKTEMTEENPFLLNHALCCFLPLIVTQLTCHLTGHFLYFSSPKPTSLNHCFPHLYSPQWLRIYLCFSPKLHHTHSVPHTHSCSYRNIFFAIYLLVLMHQTVRDLLSLLPFSSIPFCSLYEEKYLFSFIKAFYPWERENLLCLQYRECVCVYVCVRGMWSNARGYYEETEMRQEIPLIGNKTPSYLFK